MSDLTPETSNNLDRKRGRPRLHDHIAVLVHAEAHPELTQMAIGRHFNLRKSQVHYIFRVAGIPSRHRGRPPKVKPDERGEWEQILHTAGLGMDRGLTCGGKRILYGENYNY